MPLDQSQPSFYRYTAFGEEKLEGLSVSPWRYSSKRTDDKTGFVNYGRRYYLPSHGRWLTPDPLGFTAGMNLYAFVQNDPLTHLDDYGLLTQSSWDRTKTFARDTYNSPRFQGGLQAFGGLAEAGVGAGLTYVSGGLAAPVGWTAVAHGLDHFFTGVKSVYYGRSMATATNQLLQRAGASPAVAAFGDNALGMATTMGGAACARAVYAGTNWAMRNYKMEQNLQQKFSSPVLLTPQSSITPTADRLLINFTNTANKHMNEVGRRIPLHTLDDIIKSATAITKDPQGAPNAMMYYSKMWKNGKLYNAEVLYDPVTNNILHFQYTQKTIGPLPKVSK